VGAGPERMALSIGMEFYLVEAFPQFVSLAVAGIVNSTLWPVDAANNPAHFRNRAVINIALQ